MDAIIESTPLYLEGFVETLKLLAISGVGAFIVGVLVAAMRISPIPTLRTFATAYTELLRNIPLLLVLVAAVILLFTGRYRTDLFALVIGLLSWFWLGSHLLLLAAYWAVALGIYLRWEREKELQSLAVVDQPRFAQPRQLVPPRRGQRPRNTRAFGWLY